MNLYKILRSFTKLPRPNEVWKKGIENSWRPITVYLYLKLAVTQTLGHAGILLGILQTVLMISLKLDQSGWWSVSLMMLLGVVGLAVTGHIMIVLGIMKKETELTNGQNDEFQEMKEDIKLILNHLKISHPLPSEKGAVIFPKSERQLRADELIRKNKELGIDTPLEDLL